MLTETAIKAAKPREKPYKESDARGLYLLIAPTGARLWRLKYRHGGVEKLLALGAWPDVSLKRAREKRDDARKLIADGIDPAARRKAERMAAVDTFSALAREYLDVQRKALHPKTIKKAQWLLDDWLDKHMGSIPVRQVTAADVLAVCRRLQAKEKRESAHRVRALASRVMRYGVATGRCERDPCGDLRGALEPIGARNRAAITEPGKLGELLRAIDGYQGQPSTTYALKILPYCFVRPGEVRMAEWCEFDLDGKEPHWRIPAGRMKMREPHIVPLARQVVALLEDLQPITGDGRLLFPSLRSPERPISDNTINAALRRLGFSGDEHVGHGFRSTASTLLNEQGWHPDLIELQLAHVERNKVRSAYNKAQRLAERRQMMQAWADYLDGLKAGGKVVPIRRAGR
jgi:integrase